MVIHSYSKDIHTTPISMKAMMSIYGHVHGLFDFGDILATSSHHKHLDPWQQGSALRLYTTTSQDSSILLNLRHSSRHLAREHESSQNTKSEA